MRPLGALLVDFGGGTRAPWSDPCEERRHGVFHIRPGVSARHDVAAQLGEQATVRPLRPLGMTVRRSLRQDLDELQRQIHAWTWPYDAGQMRAACSDVVAWAADEGWPLDREVELERTIQWWAFERTF